MTAAALLLTAPLLVVGSLAALSVAYLLVLTLAASGHRPRPLLGAPSHRLVVLIPAHDEEELIARCVDSLHEQDYPVSLHRVVVVADNCADRTAEVAAAHGAEVMVRNDAAHPGKGRALRWAMDQLLAGSWPVDAAVVVDADSVVAPDLLAQLEFAMRSGAPVVQADYEVLVDHANPRSRLVEAGFLLFHRVRFAGRAVLGLPPALVGNGMLFSRAVMSQHPWDAFSGVEDLEYTINLRLGGVRPVFAAGARVWGPIASTSRGSDSQRARWEGGRFHVIRRRLPDLVQAMLRGRLDVLDAAVDLAVVPVGLLATASLATASIALLLMTLHLALLPALLPSLVALIGLVVYVPLGLVVAGAPAESYAALLQAPVFVARKMIVYARLTRSFDPDRFDRADRGSLPPSGGGRVEIAGVPIDRVDMASAVDGVVEAMEGRKGDALVQVCTVNLDFLVQAQRDVEVREIFRRSALNVADGAPVVWLGRLLGRSVPARVAGADMVPRLVGAAAQHGRGVFLLGGEGGVAADAARVLRERHPGLVVDWYEPPRATLDDMDDDFILQRITASGASLLLVALGHPKQERWIHRNRDMLTVQVAVGVGCCLDLIANRVRRAPVWMQKLGLEWLFRMGQEPRRLVGRYATDGSWLLRMGAEAVSERLRIRPAERAA